MAYIYLALNHYALTLFNGEDAQCGGNHNTESDYKNFKNITENKAIISTVNMLANASHNNDSVYIDVKIKGINNETKNLEVFIFLLDDMNVKTYLQKSAEIDENQTTNIKFSFPYNETSDYTNFKAVALVQQTDKKILNARLIEWKDIKEINEAEIGIYLNSKKNNTIKNCVITNFSYGIYLNSSSNNTLTNNQISDNKIGIFSNASNSTINNNFVWGNELSDFNSTYWLSSFGENNTCDNAEGWNDAGIEKGCTRLWNGTLCDEDGDYYVKQICGGTDCDDNKAILNPNTVWFYDADNDTYGNATNYTISCNKPSGNYVLYGLGLDCDDNDANITHQCCTQYDFDNNAAVDIFDVVSALENLSGGNAQIYNTICSEANGNGRIDLIDVFALIAQIVIG